MVCVFIFGSIRFCQRLFQTRQFRVSDEKKNMYKSSNTIAFDGSSTVRDYQFFSLRPRIWLLFSKFKFDVTFFAHLSCFFFWFLFCFVHRCTLTKNFQCPTSIENAAFQQLTTFQFGNESTICIHLDIYIQRCVLYVYMCILLFLDRCWAIEHKTSFTYLINSKLMHKWLRK